MKHAIKVTQVLRVEKWTIITVEADTLAAAIEAVHTGEIDLPSAADDLGNVWCMESCSLEHEDYRSA
ncbi:hypothetical protein SAMN05518849_12829 [Sphingobium sp. AP50]|uniref:hypothetical protein n=1 Tax=Sphingobium sp. AP50 TaxID=1884369 RepID=UPI0008BC9118|nr:hypothetical protein [Sphingobium sp. AP50]SEK02170.1 hypothetical protein SAMN05518849_12829 [Sphingobium sp. AP50]